MARIAVLDTTLRDGAQRERISLAVKDLLVDASNGEHSWVTLGSAVIITEPSIRPLLDSLELLLPRRAS